MTNMVGRVARAIDPEEWATQDGLAKYSPDLWASPVEAERREGLTNRARAAVEAMLEPTEEMIQAAWTATQKRSPEEYLFAAGVPASVSHAHKMRVRYKAMIIAALSTPTT